MQQGYAGIHVVNGPVFKDLLHKTCYEWWWGEDSNLRRLRRQIYSLIPLAAREPHLSFGAGTPNRTEDILITSEMLYLLSYTGLFSARK